MLILLVIGSWFVGRMWCVCVKLAIGRLEVLVGLFAFLEVFAWSLDSPVLLSLVSGYDVARWRRWV